MKIVLIGPQFSGKGTLARMMERELGLVQISTGDLFRENIKNGTALGKEAETYMNKGVLVPLPLTLSILKEKLKSEECKNGFVLDGFPRNLDQANALEDIVKIDTVILLDAPRDVIMRRCLGRRTCSKCGEIYNTSTYDKPTCKKCGSPLFQRDDDNLDSIKVRLEVYEKETTPLINFYADRLFVVDGSKTPEETFESVKNFLMEKTK